MSSSKPRPVVEEKAVAVGEYSVNVAMAGAGPAVVMLHGEGQSSSWKDWERLLGLAGSYRLIVPDMVGFGRSSRLGETPSYRDQARVIHELLEVLKVEMASFVGYSWGGQVALEVAIGWPESVENLALVASTYEKRQLALLSKLRRPSLIVWAEDDFVTQLKGGYLLRDALGTSRLEVLQPVAKDPKHDFTYAHRLLESRSDEISKILRAFLSSPSSTIAEPPEIEKELRGMALKRETGDSWGKSA